MKPIITGRDESTVIHTRLAGQLLLGSSMRTPQDVVSYMGAMQAQEYLMAKWAVGMRLPGSTDTSIEEAFNRGEILRTHVLRPTWHFVAPQHIRWMLSLCADRIKATCRSRDRDLGLTEQHYTRSNELLQCILEGHQYLTRAKIAEIFIQQGLPADSSHMIHYMMRAEVEGLVCSGALQGNKHTYALLEERVPRSPALTREEALAKLASIYFTSHGPATVADFFWWSGLSMTEAKQAMESIRNNFDSETTGKFTYLFSVSPLLPKEQNSLLLLPAFDEYLVSYKNRELVLPPQNHSRAISGNGIFRPVIIQNGAVVGIWSKKSTKDTAIIPQFFIPPSQTTLNRMAEPQAAYKVFLTGK